jgi:hypothetical protein
MWLKLAMFTATIPLVKTDGKFLNILSPCWCKYLSVPIYIILKGTDEYQHQLRISFVSDY